MTDTVRVLILEDVPADAEMNLRCLRKAGIDVESLCVDTRATFVAALRDFEPDLILADFSLPQFDGIAALCLAQELLPHVPPIIVTGSIDEETAVECIRGPFSED